MTSGALAERPDSTDVTDDLDVTSKLLGDLSVSRNQVYTLQKGIFGFPEANNWLLMPAEKDGLFWFQSIEFEALTFLLMDPFQYVDGYSVQLTSRAVGELVAADPGKILTLAILTLPREDGALPTVNLQGPIVLNVVERLGLQAVVESQFGIRHPVVL